MALHTANEPACHRVYLRPAVRRWWRRCLRAFEKVNAVRRRAQGRQEMGARSQVMVAPAQNNDAGTLLRHRLQFRFDSSQCVSCLTRGNSRVV